MWTKNANTCDTADARRGQRGVQAGLLQVAHVDRDRADGRRRHERGEAGGELRGEGAHVRELLRHEARQRQRGADEREDREAERREAGPAPLALRTQPDEVDLRELGEQDVAPRCVPATIVNRVRGFTRRSSSCSVSAAEGRSATSSSRSATMSVLAPAHPAAGVGRERDWLQRRAARGVSRSAPNTRAPVRDRARRVGEQGRACRAARRGRCAPARRSPRSCRAGRRPARSCRRRP